MKHIKHSLSALGLAIGMAAGGMSLSVSAAEPTLSEADYEQAKLQTFSVVLVVTEHYAKGQQVKT